MGYLIVSLVDSAYDLQRELVLTLCKAFVLYTIVLFPTYAHILSSLLSNGKLISYSMNSLNTMPWIGLVNFSAHILSTGKCSISRSPCPALSMTKRYFLVICLVRLDLDNLPLFSKSMELLFSYISLLCVILYPCDSMKYPDYSIMDMPLSTPIISSSMELFPFIFFFMEKLYTTPLNGGHHAPSMPS